MTNFTQSGYPVVVDYGDPQLISNPVVPGTNDTVKVYGGLRKGDTATVLLYVLARFHREVEPLRQESGVWGFTPKKITGGDGSTWSNHAGGVAVDANAARHPQGSSGTFTATQAQAIRAIVADLGGIADWGGEWQGSTTDEMHIQLHGGIAGTGRVAEVAAAIRSNKLPRVPAELLHGGAGPKTGPVVEHQPLVHPTAPDHAPPYPLAAGTYYGPFEGPAESISGSGSHDTEAMRHGLAVWQSRMQKNGASITIDGYYGAETGSVARRLQQTSHLVVDGLIGPKTWQAAWA